VSWFERLQQASFRGVEFSVEEIGSRGGRRKQKVAIPDQDAEEKAVRVHNLGMGERTFSVTAFLAGDDYDLDLQRLENALDEPGPGLLVHPYRGTRLVEIEDGYDVTESRSSGGYAAITFVAVVVGATDQGGLVVTSDPVSSAGAAADVVAAPAVDDFANDFSVDGLPAAFRESSEGAFADVMEAIETARSQLGAALDASDEIGGQVRKFNADLSTLLDQPAECAGQLVAIVRGVLDPLLQTRDTVIGAGSELLRAVDVIWSFADAYIDIPSTSTNRSVEAQNRSAVVRSVHVAVVAEAARVGTSIGYDSRQSALAVRDDIVRRIDLIADHDDPGDKVFVMLDELRAQVHDALSVAAAALPELGTYTPRFEMPALLLAHLLYGDARRGDEIVARNNPENPGLLSTSDDLEVLRS